MPWLLTRLTVGVRSDTVFTLTLSDGVVTAYAQTAPNASMANVKSFHLPHYFVAPDILEEYGDGYSWIHFGGEEYKFTEARHVHVATVAPTGKIYAIRNYEAQWEKHRDERFETQGRWKVIARSLEIYDSEGNLLGAYELPGNDVDWLRTDMLGRLFLQHGDAVVVVQDPTEPLSVCPPLPDHISITAADGPVPPVPIVSSHVSR